MPTVALPRTPPRGRLFSAVSVVLVTVGCAPPRPRTPEAATEALRERFTVGAHPASELSVLRAGDAHGPRPILVHGTPGSATAWADDLVPVANVPFTQTRLTGARCVKTVLLDRANHFLPWNGQTQARQAITMAPDPAC